MEYLNIDYHVKRLLIIALARFKTKKEQCVALGITLNTLNSYLKKYEL